MSTNASRDSKNVLIVAGIFPPDIGGPATYVPSMASELAKHGHKVTVVTLSDALDHDDRSYPFPVVRLRRGMFKALRVIMTVAVLLRRGRQADVLFVNGLYLEAIIANVFLRKPLVQKLVGDWAWERATNKGWVKDNFEQFQKRRYSPKVEALKTLRNLYVRWADTVLAPSRYLARWISHWGVPKEKIAVIYNAVELGSFSPSTVPLSTRIKFVTVGRLVSWKQVDRLIEAIGEYDEVGLVIVGDGPQRESLEKLVHSRDVADRVYFAGQRGKEEMLSLMAACDVFVLNSTYEGFPHVVLEAMSVGLPVLATAVGGTPEVVRDGENGVLIPPNGNGALSKALLKVVSSSVERHRLAVGAKRTAERFRHSVMVQETEDLLENCIHLHIEAERERAIVPSE